MSLVWFVFSFQHSLPIKITRYLLLYQTKYAQNLKLLQIRLLSYQSTSKSSIVPTIIVPLMTVINTRLFFHKNKIVFYDNVVRLNHFFNMRQDADLFYKLNDFRVKYSKYFGFVSANQGCWNDAKEKYFFPCVIRMMNTLTEYGNFWADA